MTDLPNCPICGALADWHEYDTPDEYGVICCAPSTERCPMMMDGPITEATWRALDSRIESAERLAEERGRELVELRGILKHVVSSLDGGYDSDALAYIDERAPEIRKMMKGDK